MTNTHTPGPWECSGIAIMAGGHCIATCDTEAANTSDKINKANARLIAAAPDLLALVQEVLSDELASLAPGTIERARAAIAKATGDA